MERLQPQNLQPDIEPDESTKGSISASQSNVAKIGKYEVLNEIGRGGMSIVYKARDQELNRLVAIKLMLKASNETLNLLRFQQEARAASQLDHPNIVKVHDFSTTEDGTPYLVMSYLDGISLADAIKNEGSFSLGRWLSVMIQACDALDHAHIAGIVHRDIKPSNFVLAQEHGTEVLKLVDFGIAKNSFDDMSLTKTGEIFGSPLYMSPEQCAGAKLDSRSDIYSLGCVMYEALAERPPISGENSLSTLQKHLTDKPERLSKLKLKTKNIQQLDRIVMRCLEKRPDDRYQNLGELKKELEQLWKGQTADSTNLARIKIPLVVASVLLGLTVFAISTNFERIGNSLHFSPRPPKGAAKTNSSVDPIPTESQSIAEKKSEFDRFNDQYVLRLNQQDLQGALVAAKQVTRLAAELKLPPFIQADYHLKQANCEKLSKHPVYAAEQFDQALLLMENPQTPGEQEARFNALMQYGGALRKAAMTERAKLIFHKALALAVQQNNKKRQSEALQYLGSCDQKNEDYAGCLAHWKHALELDPSDKKLLKEIRELEQKQLKNIHP